MHGFLLIYPLRVATTHFHHSYVTCLKMNKLISMTGKSRELQSIQFMKPDNVWQAEIVLTQDVSEVSVISSAYATKLHLSY